MLYLPIRRSWLISKSARRVYAGCSVLTLALLATLVGIQLSISAAGASPVTREARSLMRILLLPEIIGYALLWIAMWYFWFGFDDSHYFKKAVTFVLLLFFPPIGTLLYYFLTYRRRVLPVASPSLSEMNA
jgi:hypothetical protein